MSQQAKLLNQIREQQNQQIRKEKHHISLIHQLEDAVLSLESAGEDEKSIHSMVAMILRGFIVEGQLTPEYIGLANEALAYRRAIEEQQQLRKGSSISTSSKDK